MVGNQIVMKVSAKCSDMFVASLYRYLGGKYKEAEILGDEYIGYVPSFMPDGGGDYLDLEIDVNTGQILNWKKPSESQLKKAFRIKW